ncbi:MAG: hypothetical protein QOK28_2313 [Actinomycetota bacterium]
MRIGLVAPPWFEVPPTGHGGIETLVATLARELAQGGHEVTVATVRSSESGVRQWSHFETPQSEFLWGKNHAAIETIHAVEAYGAFSDDRVDVIHDHSGRVFLACALADRSRDIPVVHSVHGDPDATRLALLRLAASRGIVLTAISHAQARKMQGIDISGVIENGVECRPSFFNEAPDSYCAFVGRICPEKGLDVALDAARDAEVPLTIAGRIDNTPIAAEFFQNEISPRLGAGATYVGEIGPAAKFELMRRARALLVPSRWSEPFGLVAIEALACGTPVIAFPSGGLAEIVEDGHNGFLVSSAGEMAVAISRLTELRREDCRKVAVEKFSGSRMAARYVATYEEAIESWASR